MTTTMTLAAAVMAVVAARVQGLQLHLPMVNLALALEVEAQMAALMALLMAQTRQEGLLALDVLRPWVAAARPPLTRQYPIWRLQGGCCTTTLCSTGTT